MRRPRLARWCLVLVAAAGLGSPGWSLTDEEVFRDFRFNLINPGARALGIGGAFVSLADDATAAQANPAGLGFLIRNEYFAELRLVDNGAQSSVVNETLPTGIDTFIATGTDLDDGMGLSFLSAVLTRERFSIGFSRQELVNIDNATLSSFAFTFENSPGVFLVEGVGAIEVGVVNWNVSAGVRLSDRLGLGATLTYSTLEVQSLVTNTIIDTDGVLTQQQPLLEPTLDLRTSVDDEDDDLLYNVGVLYRVPGKWGVGAVYRRGPRFTVTEQVVSLNDIDQDGVADDVFGVSDRLGGEFPGRFHLPDSFTVGGSYQVSERTTVAGDVERIRYSNLLDGYVSGVNVLTGPDAVFEIEDATDVRAGVEYLLFNTGNRLPPLALRGGAIAEQPSTIRARTTGSDSFATEAVFRDRGRQWHATLGLGVVLQQYRIDLAADFSETDNEYLVSFIYRRR